MATNIYPRGTTQWWRRSVRFIAVLRSYNNPDVVEDAMPA